MSFIQEHIWSIFEIKHKEDCSFDEAFDMFIFNVELGYDRYKGAKGISYKNLNKKWEKIAWFAKEEQKLKFKNLTRKYMVHLVKAFNTNDKESFQAICNIKV